MSRTILLFVVLCFVTLEASAADWHLAAENATTNELNDVSVSCGEHKITFGVLGYDTRWRVKKRHLFVSDVVGRQVPTNVVVRYTTPDKKKHKVEVGVPKTIKIGSKETLVVSIGPDQKVAVRKDN